MAMATGQWWPLWAQLHSQICGDKEGVAFQGPRWPSEERWRGAERAQAARGWMLRATEGAAVAPRMVLRLSRSGDLRAL